MTMQEYDFKVTVYFNLSKEAKALDIYTKSLFKCWQEIETFIKHYMS